MKICTLNDFMKTLAPWLDDEYIREARMNAKGHIVLSFRDGVSDVYWIDNCTKDQVRDVLRDLKAKGVAVS